MADKNRICLARGKRLSEAGSGVSNFIYRVFLILRSLGSTQEGNEKVVLLPKSLKMLKAIHNSLHLSIWSINLVHSECMLELHLYLMYKKMFLPSWASPTVYFVLSFLSLSIHPVPGRLCWLLTEFCIFFTKCESSSIKWEEKCGDEVLCPAGLFVCLLGVCLVKVTCQYHTEHFFGSQEHLGVSALPCA